MDFTGFPGLAGKTAIVTGSTQGLGADIARGLAAAGVNVVLVGRNAEAGRKLEDELDGRALYCETDIGQDAQIQRCIDAAVARFGRLDILVNNACQYADRGLASSREEWHNTLDTNLVSAAIFTQLAAPLLPRGGVVVNMGSTGGKFGAAGRALYPASKAALLQITKNFAVELAPAGVRVLAVSPAWTWSPSVEQLSGGSRPAADAVGAHFHPLGRVGSGEEIAAAVCFACSDAASWMTGVDIPVDGGFSILGPDRGISPRAWFKELAP
ncbi:MULTISPECIES: SDR family oxidoreductase [Achromobacter]|jgi:NAD(P)-dependent dehydrogenase (short-subunit alcohol dehydrogenase family)|uniref:3-oxoacyl-[acyl-carrier-protein] reductase FabG n=1 Tax=Achromobacter aegrifaciens TaxID=1287736 RepID=A0AAD2J6F7_ACHAE|nr:MULTISPECIES: SDR family oxidoreductase [Achromobacter]MBD9383262.1 SDR family oxidoreductase [Achromobacter sp. ACM02]MBD9422608.1 SDR family oxidoreductase [Achromobacter sp. ACM04]MBD9430314.1 SDR family oxidoreductase [Achromobacter sp. ACM03]MBD9471849.1 SDR family oxidoreductase [Achromobacter sp. ACM01]MDQ1760901.1 SDR family oxidoreductase [Achromobacter aegrifaciens]